MTTSPRTGGTRRTGDGDVIQFDQVQQLRAHEYVAEQIRRHIALRLIRHGEALPPERELVAMFGVGRSTVRLALRRLVAEGLIEARRGRTGGTFILERPDEARAVSREPAARLLGRQQEIEELLTYRRTLEPAVARLAAQTRTPADLEAMQAALAGMTAAESEPAYMRYDTEFHVAVARATHNRHLVAAIEQIRVEINDALSLLPESETWHRRLEREHEHIFAAIEAGDRDAAEAATELHVSASDRGVRAVLASLRRPRSVRGT